MRVLFFFVISLLLSPFLSAQSIEGYWKLHANGHIFIVDIQQTDEQIEGRMWEIREDKAPLIVSRIEGEILNHRITFRRTNSRLYMPQVYEGYLFRHASHPKDKHKGMAGLFSDAGRKMFSWYAVKGEKQ